VLSAAAGALKAGGYLAFTLEHLPGAEPPAPFQLESHGRYSHSEDFVRQAVASQDLRLCSLERVVLRREGGQDVGGLLVLAARPG
jgi:predicted TPR repeat methyltransferase